MTKMKLELYCLFISFFICSTLFCQSKKIGYVISSGISKNKLSNMQNADTDWAISGSAGFFFLKKFDKNSSLKFSLLVIVINAITRNWLTGSNNPSVPKNSFQVDHNSWDKYHLTYVGISILYGFSLNKISAEIGIQPMVFIVGNYREKREFFPIGTLPKIDRNYDLNEYKRFDVGPKISLTYDINNRITGFIDYFRGMRKVFIDRYHIWHSNRQLTLGLQYSLTQKKKFSEQ
jgi:hypothetical protein